MSALDIRTSQVPLLMARAVVGSALCIPRLKLGACPWRDGSIRSRDHRLLPASSPKSALRALLLPALKDGASWRFVCEGLMNCPYCGTRNRARAEFCRHCRALLPQPAEPSRWSIIADARGPGALVLLLVAVVAAVLLGRQVVTFIGAPAAVATAPSTP